MEDLWSKLAATHRILPPEKWLEVWDRIHGLYGEARLDVIGGEPMRYPRAVELFAALSERHRVSITTNLSSSRDDLQALTDRAGPDRLHLAASYHPEFVGKIRFLLEKGFEPHVTLVAWPPFFDRILEWRTLFRGMGVPFSTLVFQGTHDGKQYPAAYDADQLALLEETIPEPAEVEYRLRQRRTLGKPCGAGHVYANVKGSGDVYRCGQDAFGHRPLGNIFDPAFRLHTEPQNCPYEHCSCGEFYFLWENYSGRSKAAAEARHS
jgi:MoaA/NifB/PqqE/SkfB family radical SAM enzyme